MDIQPRISDELSVTAKPVPTVEVSDGVDSDITFEDVLNSDARDMKRLGIQNSMKRTFSAFGVLGVNMSVMSVWVGVLSAIAFPLIDGGRAGAFWTFLANWILAMFAYLSMAEMASMIPMSGGQYRWAAEFAPPHASKPIAFVVGWLDTLAWQSINTGAAYATAHLILIVAASLRPDYVPTLWQGTLLTAAVGLAAMLFNIYATFLLPVLEGLVLIVLFVGFFAVNIPLWVLAPKAPIRDDFFEFANYGGWSGVFWACLVGSIGPSGVFVGGDSAAHFAQEVKNASRNVPRMMVISIFLGGIMGQVMATTFSAIVQDIEAQVVDSTAAYPFVPIFEQATSSKGWAIGLTILIAVLNFFIAIGTSATAGRQAWSFATDRGLPLSGWFSSLQKISNTPTPVNSLFATAVMCFVIALLGLGGPEAFDSIFGLGSAAACLTYAISIACVLYRRLFGAPLPSRKFTLGRCGIACNVIAVIYELFVCVISLFPLFAKVNVMTVNWGVTVFVGVIAIALLDYVIRGRKEFRVQKLLKSEADDEAQKTA